ncbi:MAG: exodeoxyribonuclease VII large subunit [Anaerolineae bacterium]
MVIKSVTDVTLHIKTLLENSPDLSDIWIEGEVSNFKRAASGHCYFTLKDDQAELRSVIWRMQAQRLPFEPVQGDWVEAHGYISVYERGGNYQFYVDLIERSGVGRLWQEFLRLRTRLEAEGLFAAERKRALPAWPRRIGVVTSPSGAALQDILKVLQARYPLVEVVLAPCQVQGAEAPKTIIRALNALNRLPDIDEIIVARGGGSLEDLWAFNDEGVARAVAASKYPVISGVGHETDFTICDYVADLRAPTPTAAATYAVPDGDILRQQINESYRIAQALVAQRFTRWRENITREKRALRLHDPRRLLAEMRQRLDSYRHQMQIQSATLFQSLRQLLLGARLQLNALDTQRVLERGYAIVQDLASLEHIHSVEQLSPLQQVNITLSDGHVAARIGPDVPGG